jgi:DNA-binding response OmpR family regulator
MPRSRTDQNSPAEQKARATPPARGPIRVLIVSTVRAQRDGLAAMLTGLGLHPALACDACTAIALLHECRYDLAIVGEGGSSREGLTIVPKLLKVQSSLACILAGEEPSLALATDAMKIGACDLIGPESTREQLTQTIAAALRRSRSIRAGELWVQRRARKLKGACRELERSRSALLGQFQTLCNSVSGSYRDLSDQIKHVTLAAELNAILRQELDLESLLRTVLEYVLKKIGSTNAAIFLPNTAGDYTLGAYVNYDCPKDSAEMMLDHLADVLAPALENREDIAVMRGLEGLRPATDPQPVGGTTWLQDSAVAAFSCRQDNECLGVVVLFRDRRNPFPPAALHALKIIRELFGKQLARVIRTHHRHVPKNQWGGFKGGDDIDLAA